MNLNTHRRRWHTAQAEYILKPVTPQAVKKALRTLVRQIEKRRALQEEIKTLTQQLQKIRPAIRDRFSRFVRRKDRNGAYYKCKKLSWN